MPASGRFQTRQGIFGRLTRGSVRLLIGLQVILMVLVVSGVYIASEHLREVTLGNMEHHAQSHTQNLNDRLAYSLDLLQLHLDTLINDHPEAAIDIDVLRDTLGALQTKLGYIRSIAVIDVSNRIFLSTQPLEEGHRIDLGPLQPVGKPGNIGLLRFAAPWYGHNLAEGGPFTSAADKHITDSGFIPVTLTLEDTPQWNFLIALNSDYFINLVSEQSSQEGLTFRVILDDGTLLFSSSADDPVGSRLPDTPQLERMLHQHAGSERWHDAEKGLQLISYRAARNYPWLAQSQADATQVLEKWRQDTRQLWLISLGLLGFFLLLGGLMTSRVHRALQHEERLQESNRLAATVFMYSNDLIAIINSNQQFVATNPAYEKVTGYTAEEMLGRTPGSFLDDPEHARAYKEVWKGLEHNDDWQGEASKVHKDGRLIDGWLQVNTVRDDEGEIASYVSVFRDLTALRSSETSVRKLLQAVEQSPSSIVMTNLEAEIEYVNPQFLRATGYSLAEALGANPRILQSGLTPRSTFNGLWDKVTRGEVWHGEFINKSKDGRIYHERSSISPVTDDKGNTTGYLAIKHDITREREAERSLLLSASIIENAADGMLICDERERIIEVNPAFTLLTGYTAEEVAGRHPIALGDARRNHDTGLAMHTTLQSGPRWKGEFYGRHKDGRSYVLDASVSTIRDQDGTITNYICIFSDVTERKLQQEHLQQLAHFDPLTGLVNRSLLLDRLNQALAHSCREARWLAVCFMDLDGFKGINDTHGHAAGDELLIEMARRLKAAVRQTDTVARMGGDEFVLLLGLGQSFDECRLVAQRVLDCAAAPLKLSSGAMVQVAASVGITLFPLDDSTGEKLLEHADQAMYQAKQAGGNRFLYAAEIRGPEGSGS